jgi:hypothetical protein
LLLVCASLFLRLYVRADSVITTTVTDLYAVDIINQLDASVSAGYTVTDTAAVVFSGTTRFQRLLSLPLGYVAKLTDTFALTVTYRGEMVAVVPVMKRVADCRLWVGQVCRR